MDGCAAAPEAQAVPADETHRALGHERVPDEHPGERPVGQADATERDARAQQRLAILALVDGDPQARRLVPDQHGVPADHVDERRDIEALVHGGRVRRSLLLRPEGVQMPLAVGVVDLDDDHLELPWRSRQR